MADMLTWDEIKKHYPDEWVVLVACEFEGDIPTSGAVIDHGSVKRAVYQRLGRSTRSASWSTPAECAGVW